MELSQPSYLPPELAEQVLLHTPTEDLSSLCRSSRLYYDICLSPVFWKRRFNLPFPLSSLVDTSNFTLEQWLELNEHVEKSLQRTQASLEALKQDWRITVYFTGSSQEREALKSPGIDYTLYEEFLPRAEEIFKEYSYASGREFYYEDKYENSGSRTDQKMFRVYRELVESLERFFPYIELYYEHGSFRYTIHEERGVLVERHTLSEEEAEELIFRLHFFRLGMESNE